MHVYVDICVLCACADCVHACIYIYISIYACCVPVLTVCMHIETATSNSVLRHRYRDSNDIIYILYIHIYIHVCVMRACADCVMHVYIYISIYVCCVLVLTV